MKHQLLLRPIRNTPLIIGNRKLWIYSLNMGQRFFLWMLFVCIITCIFLAKIHACIVNKGHLAQVDISFWDIHTTPHGPQPLDQLFCYMSRMIYKIYRSKRSWMESDCWFQFLLVGHWDKTTSRTGHSLWEWWQKLVITMQVIHDAVACASSKWHPKVLGTKSDTFRAWCIHRLQLQKDVIWFSRLQSFWIAFWTKKIVKRSKFLYNE